MPFNKIRKLIIHNKEKEAFSELLKVTDIKEKDKIILLNYQFNQWYEKDILGQGAPVHERNKIIYSVLTIITALEKENTTGSRLRKLENLEEIEKKLAVTYIALSTLYENGPIDIFLEWFMETEPNLFDAMLTEEKINQNATGFNAILTNLNIEDFIKKNKLSCSTQQIRQYISLKNTEIPRFFSGWINYNRHRKQEKKKLVHSINEQQKKYKPLLYGVIGGVLSYVTPFLIEYIQSNFLSENITEIDDDPLPSDDMEFNIDDDIDID